MKHIKTYLCIALLITCALHNSFHTELYAQSGYWRIFFKDKGNEIVAPGSNLWYATMAIHSERAINRRKKNNPKAQVISIADAPVNKGYVSSVSKYVDTVLLTLRWNNYIVVKTDSARLGAIKSLPFVKAIQRTGVKMFPAFHTSIQGSAFINNSEHSLLVLKEIDNCGVFRYGASYNQAAMLQIPQIHAMGITGKHALLSFLDSGFRWKGHKATNTSDIFAEYDFIQKDSITENQNGDVPSQDYHGTICFSTVSGFLQDSLIGISPHSSFLLAKTEDIPTEQHLEEDNYAAAVEWSEALGADLISSSLGYSAFNQPFEEDYAFSNFDGKTTITARIVNEAVKRGVICVTAAGNDGPRDSTLITPSDADSVISVGALAPDGSTPANFTSRGPRADGRAKPDIASQGIGVVCINPSDTLSLSAANGTSLATPLIAGSMGLMISAFPEKKGYELRSALIETAVNAKNKDNTLGYGLARIHDAMLQTGILVSPMITYPVSQYQRIVYLVQSAFPVLDVTVYYRQKGEKTFLSSKAFRHDTMHAWAIDLLLDTMSTNEYECYVLVNDSKRTRVYPARVPTQDSVFVFEKNSMTIPCGIPENILPKHAYPMSVHEQISGINECIINQDGDYRFSIYALNGQLLEVRTLALQSGTYTRDHFRKLLGMQSFIAIVIHGHHEVLYSCVLPPFL